MTSREAAAAGGCSTRDYTHFTFMNRTDRGHTSDDGSVYPVTKMDSGESGGDGGGIDALNKTGFGAVK